MVKLFFIFSPCPFCSPCSPAKDGWETCCPFTQSWAVVLPFILIIGDLNLPSQQMEQRSASSSSDTTAALFSHTSSCTVKKTHSLCQLLLVFGDAFVLMCLQVWCGIQGNFQGNKRKVFFQSRTADWEHSSGICKAGIVFSLNNSAHTAIQRLLPPTLGCWSR